MTSRDQGEFVFLAFCYTVCPPMFAVWVVPVLLLMEFSTCPKDVTMAASVVAYFVIVTLASLWSLHRQKSWGNK